MASSTARALYTVLHRWHRRIGLAAALFLAAIAGTGVLINHAPALGLDRSHASASWLLDWYGIAPRTLPRAFAAGPVWLIWIDGTVYAHGRPLAALAKPPVGVAAGDEMMAIAAADAIAIFTPEGELVDRLDGASLPGKLMRIGKDETGALVIDTGLGRFRSDPEWMTFAPFPGDAEWSAPGMPPAEEMAGALRAFRGQGVTWERVLLDVHSGRLFGVPGTVLADFSALAVFLLAASGLYNWWLRR